jgi:hypothetical protein
MSNITAESNTIFKNLVLPAHGTIRFRFLEKSQKKISCLCRATSLSRFGRKISDEAFFLMVENVEEKRA